MKCNLPATRKEALALGTRRYFTGKPCKRGHVAERRSSDTHCIVCRRERRKEQEVKYPGLGSHRSRVKRAARPEQYAKAANRNYMANRELVKARSRERYRDNASRVNERARAWQKSNPEKVSESNRRWCKRHPHKCRAEVAKRNAAKRKATPRWLTHKQKEMIAEIYEHAHFLSIAHGVEFHVDHIYPIRGKLVTGLHHPDNLQILSASENARKGNR